MDNLSPDTQVEMLRVMQTIRRFEERASADFHAGRIYGVVHCYIGEEAVASQSFVLPTELTADARLFLSPVQAQAMLLETGLEDQIAWDVTARLKSSAISLANPAGIMALKIMVSVSPELRDRVVMSASSALFLMAKAAFHVNTIRARDQT